MADEQASPKSLSHIRVLDLTRVLAGPWATQNLADLGAEVIKIERPGTGDDTRAWGPPFLKNGEGKETTDASYFISANRGKKSVTLDISTAEGQEIVRTLAKQSDVFVENYKVGTLARYGLSYDDLKEVNPRLVYCSVTGYGQDGPYASQPGYDFVFQGMSGLMSLTGFPENGGSGGPVKVGIAVADVVTGMYASTAILAALEYRHRSNRGQYIDLSLLDSAIALIAYQATNYFLSGRIPTPLGNAHPNMVPYQVFDCKDGKVIVAVGNDSQYASFCRVLGRKDLETDERFVKVAGRVRHREVLIADIARHMPERTMTEWLHVLEAANVPCGPIYNMKQVFEDDHVVERNIRTDIAHGAGGTAPNVANPIRMSDTPITYESAAPVLGQHTDEILGGLAGLDQKRIAELRQARTV
ncbi:MULTISPECIES: CaiB/BaiF CoA transferase family protein [Polaromonas]|uniref:CaiB/BaiF CoA transferase family protein n=1 Tax=Polaromonas aquatica TaxID=332657 RepID=A0ABW1U5L7_9BURK